MAYFFTLAYKFPINKSLPHITGNQRRFYSDCIYRAKCTVYTVYTLYYTALI